MAKKSEPKPETNTEQTTKKESQLKNLPPWDIDPETFQGEEDAKLAQERMNKWLEEFQKDLSQLLEKNGISVFTLDFLHKGSKTPILLTRGNSYVVAKLAKHAAIETKTRVEQELSL